MTVDRTTETTEGLTGPATEVATAEEGMTEVVTIEEGMTALLLEGPAAAVVPHPHRAHQGHGAPQQTTTHLTSLETGKRRQEQRGETKDLTFFVKNKRNKCDLIHESKLSLKKC